jgi:16S rRNA (guanine527-N7)-methyltransferase
MNLVRATAKNLNLTSKSDLINLYTKHFLPCLAILEIVNFKVGSHIIDIGTGGGFPGIPIKILRPDLELTLIDSNKKKIFFVDSVIRKLNLNRIQTIPGRIEDLTNPTRFDYAVSWGVSTLDILVSWWLPISKKHGQLVTIKGSNLENEISSLNEKQSNLKIESFFSVLLENSNQKIVIISHEENFS